MRKNRRILQKNFRILALDDDVIMTSTLQAYFQRSGYMVDVINDPCQAVEQVKKIHYDILLLDFLMAPICGDQVVEEIRKFNKDIYIILLTGHKSMAPPIKTIRELDIQGYYEKSDRFDQLELLVESCVKSISQMRTILSYKNGLSHVIDILPRIYELDSRDTVLESVLSITGEVFHSRRCFLALSDEAPGIEQGSISVCGGLEKDEVRKIVEEADFSEGDVWDRDNLLLGLIEREDKLAVGVLGVELGEPAEYVQMQIMEIYARQIASALHNMQLHHLVRRKNEELTLANSQLNDSYVEIINAMRAVVDERDIYTRGHSDRVSALAADIARQMGKSTAYVDRVRLCGLFHDIGKVGISDQILLKPGKLTEEEYASIKKHSEKGAKILSVISLFKDAVPIVRAHHERVDGKGYPDGLKGDEIPEEARIIAVADSFDAMTSDRYYRRGLPIDKAKEELERGKGSQFDPAVVEGFMELFRSCGEEEFRRKYMFRDKREENA